MVDELFKYKTAITAFENTLKGFSYKTFYINEKEKVFLIEDSLILYVGFLTYFEDWYGECCCSFIEKEQYILKIEEITYNSIDFKAEPEKISNLLSNIINKSIHCNYFKFFSCNARTIDYRIYKCIERPKLGNKINLLLPELQILNRIDAWEGVPYYFVVIEVLSFFGEKGIGIFWTISKPHLFISRKCKDWINEGFRHGNFNAVGNGFENAFFSWKGKKLKRKEILEQNLTYYFIEEKIKDKNELWKNAYKIYENALACQYDNVERFKYTSSINKWKTEELLYKLVKKLFKENKVIYQHRPFFLRSLKGGQMSYDIFICGLNIAIEYQGIQHFKPVDFFGGVNTYKETVERDKLKQDLSKQYNIKLIYFYYWENIDSNLIKKKLEF